MSVAVQSTRETNTLERRTIRLQVVSPIHIGTREGRLLPMEFLFSGNKVYMIDEDKLGRLLKERGLLDEFVNAARTGEIGKGTGWFLRQKGRLIRTDELVQKISRYSVEGGSSEMRDFRPFVRDGFGRVYLPGTSLKGVFRTAVLFAFAKADDKLKSLLESKVSQGIDSIAKERNKERAKKSFSEKLLQADLLQSFSLANAKQEQNKDLLRCLRVRDAYAVGDTCRSRVIKIQFLSKKQDGSFYWSEQKRGGRDTGTPLSIWLETIVSGTFETEIVWDHALFEAFSNANPGVKHWPVSNLAELLGHVSTMMHTMIAYERTFYSGRGETAAQSLRRWYDTAAGQMFRIGFGSGMLGTSVNLLWQESIRQKIRNTCGHERGEDPAPKSRRIWQNSKGEWFPMGWLRFATSADEPSGKAALTPEPILTAPARPSQAPRETTFMPKAGQPVPDEKTPSVKDLLARAKSIVPGDTLNLGRIVDCLDDLETSDAASVAAALKNRLEKAGQWKKHPKRAAIEVFLVE